MSHQLSSVHGTLCGLKPLSYILVQTVIACSLSSKLQQLTYVNNVGNRHEVTSQENEKMYSTPTPPTSFRSPCSTSEADQLHLRLRRNTADAIF